MLAVLVSLVCHLLIALIVGGFLVYLFFGRSSAGTSASPDPVEEGDGSDDLISAHHIEMPGHFSSPLARARYYRDRGLDPFDRMPNSD